MKRIEYFLSSILFAVIIFTISCSTPSNDEINNAVKLSLQKSVPVSLAKHLTGGQNAIIDEIKVLEIGKVIERGSKNYWPVKIYARGTCTKMFGGRQHFEGETEYYITKNDYGELIATPKGF
jgi:hypothetical protein